MIELAPCASLFPVSLVTTLCLQWEPKAIAVAFIYLAGKLSKYDLQAATHSKSRYWWRQFVDTLDIHDLESECLLFSFPLSLPSLHPLTQVREGRRVGGRERWREGGAKPFPPVLLYHNTLLAVAMPTIPTIPQ